MDSTNSVSLWTPEGITKLVVVRIFFSSFLNDVSEYFLCIKLILTSIQFFEEPWMTEIVSVEMKMSVSVLLRVYCQGLN